MDRKEILSIVPDLEISLTKEYKFVTSSEGCTIPSEALSLNRMKLVSQ